MLTRKDIEIMSPVGSFASLRAAIQGGANSIYFGVEKMNMRSRSSGNFSLEDLNEIVNIAGKHGINTYLTVNIVVYDDEKERIGEIINKAKEAGVTAIIASDMAVILQAMEAGMPVHASTQLNISNFDALKFYASFADVVVLARELHLEQVKKIYDKVIKEKITGPSGEMIKLELFAHGALCMSISGKCYLSLHEYNASANRGACYQVCRRGYTVTDKETNRQLDIDNEYLMSPKDLCTIHFLDKILDAGIRVLKIEGRARSPEYVKTVTECYGEAVQAIINGDYTQENIRKWREKLSTVFNRGFWDGYYLGQKLGEWSKVYGSKATKRKIYVAKGKKYFDNIRVGEFTTESGSLAIGDEYLITGPSTGVIEGKVEEIRVDDKMVPQTTSGENFSMPVERKIRASDKLYKIVVR